MKKLVGLVAVLIFLSFTVNAQETKKRVQKKAKLTSEQMATLQAKKMALQLDLDANQQKAVYNLLKETADNRQKMMEQFKQNGVKKLTEEEKNQMQKNRLDWRLAYKTAMKKILTEEQYKKWPKMDISKNQREAMKKKRAAAVKKRNQEKEKLSTEQTASLQAKKMALQLDLDANQQKAVYKLLKEGADDRQKMMEQFKQKKQNGVKITTEEKFQLESNRLTKQLAHKAAMKKILKEEQYEKWTKTTRAKSRRGREVMKKKRAAASKKMNQQRKRRAPAQNRKRRN